MPRNASGTYSLPVSAYVAGTTIRSADMNSNLSDIATALTQSLATTGVSSMTGVLKLSGGSAGAPSLTLASDTTTGWYNSSAGTWTYVSSGAAVLALSSSGAILTGSLSVSTSGSFGTTLNVTGASTLGGSLTVSSTIIAVTSSGGISARNTTNDTSEQTQVTLSRGSGAGDTWTWRTVGGAANDVTTLRGYVGTTHVVSYSTSGFSPKKQLIIDAGIIIMTTAGYTDYTEIATPSASSANIARHYAKDLSGTTIMAYIDSSSIERPITPPGAVITSGYDDSNDNSAMTTVMPYDDTIPQITEGTEILSVTITLKQSTSRVRCSFGAFSGTATTGVNTVMALFRAGNSDALQLSVIDHARSGAADVINHPIFLGAAFEEASPGAGSVTYSVRIGPGSAGTIRINGTGAGRIGGGAAKAYLIVEELSG